MTLPLTRDRRAPAGPAVPLRLTTGRRRRPGLLAGSAVLLTACSALFASAYLRAGHQSAVLAVAQPIAQGGVIAAADLRVVKIAASGLLHPVSATDAAQVVGRRASVALVPGSLLTPGDFSGAPAIPNGDAVVGVSVKAGQLPAEGVTPGETVDVVLTGVPGAPAVGSAAAVSSQAQGGQTGTSGSTSSFLTAGVLAPDVVVTTESPGTQANGGTAEVSLLVPSALAPVLASASAAGQVALVAVPSQR